jgi:hydrogenase maturation factor
MSGSSCDSTPGHCITCGDEAIEMSVLTIDTERELALCVTGDGKRETVQIGLVQPVRCADRLLVHAGTAIALQGGSR